jgi:sugar phosphate isomerase/epimerase
MRIGISNLAWDVAEDEEIAKLLRSRGVGAIDIVPRKYFGDDPAPSASEVRAVRDWWLDRGIRITGMQALLAGTKGLNIFGPPDIRCATRKHLSAICRIGGLLGASRLVFGSPKSRDRSGIGHDEAHEIATAFFRDLGDIAADNNVTLCLEPNPARYGSNFMTTSAETASVVKAIAHPAIRMQFDTGSLTINGEDPVQVLRAFGDEIGHIHVSEPDLLTLGDGETDHEGMGKALMQHCAEDLVTIEMLATAKESHVASVDRAIRLAQSWYIARPTSRMPSGLLPQPDRQVPSYDVKSWAGRRHSYCVVIPVINEGQRISRLLAKMSSQAISEKADIIIVDGGSTDGSLEPDFINGEKVAGLLSKTGAGKLSAQLRCGYAFALDQGYEGIVTIDGNDKDDPDAIPRILARLEEGVDFVQASRFIKGGVAENTPLLRLIAIRCLHAPLLSLASGMAWTDTTQGFRGYSRRLLEDPKVAPFRNVFAGYELLAYLSYRAPRLGYRCEETPSTRRYPPGEIPTKISGFRSNLILVQVLMNACLGRYDPAGGP